jgi:hypothetical protein
LPKSGMVVHVFNPNIQEAKQEDLKFEACIHSETLSPKNQNKWTKSTIIAKKKKTKNKKKKPLFLT